MHISIQWFACAIDWSVLFLVIKHLSTISYVPHYRKIYDCMLNRINTSHIYKHFRLITFNQLTSPVFE